MCFLGARLAFPLSGVRGWGSLGKVALLLQEQAGTLHLAGWLAGPHGACPALCLWLLLEQRMVPPPQPPASGRWEPVLGSDPSEELVGAGQQRSSGPWEPLSHPAGGVQMPQPSGQRREGTTVPWLLGQQLLPGLRDSLEIRARPSSPNERRHLATRRDFLLFGCGCVGRGAELGSTELRIGLILFPASRITPGDQLHPGASRGDGRAGSAPGGACRRVRVGNSSSYCAFQQLLRIRPSKCLQSCMRTRVFSLNSFFWQLLCLGVGRAGKKSAERSKLTFIFFTQ